jgi:hypothetical protein
MEGLLEFCSLASDAEFRRLFLLLLLNVRSWWVPLDLPSLLALLSYLDLAKFSS